MQRSARGTFEVKIEQEPPYDSADGVSIGRATVHKTFAGDLQGTSKVDMISAGSSEVKGSAGYVAIERVRGSLDGRAGSFVLQHCGSMSGGKGSLHVAVVPDSASGELKGLSGSMTIEIADGKHSYVFDYTI